MNETLVLTDNLLKRLPCSNGSIFVGVRFIEPGNQQCNSERARQGQERAGYQSWDSARTTGQKIHDICATCPVLAHILSQSI